MLTRRMKPVTRRKGVMAAQIEILVRAVNKG